MATSPPLPPDELARLQAQRDCGVLETLAEAQYDGIARLAAAICGTPIALVSLVDRDRHWFKARVGLDATEVPRYGSFCDHAVATPGPFVVPDALADDRFRDNPLVAGAPGLRFYAGVPVTGPGGLVLGALCVIDRVPRELTAAQLDGLVTLAGQVAVPLATGRRVAELEQAQARVGVEQERFRAFMDNSPAFAFMKDEAGRFVYVSEPLARGLSVPAECWLGRTDAELWGEEVGAALRHTDLAVLASGQPRTLYETVPTAGGNSVYWHVSKFPFTDAAGQRFLAGTAVDRTAEKDAADALRVSEEKLRAVVGGLAEGVLLVDTDSKAVLEANDAAAQLFGYPAAELAGLTYYDLCAHDRASVDANFERVARDGRVACGRRKYRHRDGTLLDLEPSASPLNHGGRRLTSVVFRDVGEQVRAEERLGRSRAELERTNERLRELAATDGLTGLMNRAAFDDRFAEAFASAARHGRALSVVMLDVDHFKAYNDAFGHPAGDGVLQTVAAKVASVARAADTVARYGGEEFVVVLPDTDSGGATALAERCRAAVANAAWGQRAVTVSVGVSTLSPRTADAATLVREADEALYRSKEGGRNRVHHGSGAAARHAAGRAP